jgi:hypothetical protein
VDGIQGDEEAGYQRIMTGCALRQNIYDKDINFNKTKKIHYRHFQQILSRPQIKTW